MSNILDKTVNSPSTPEDSLIAEGVRLHNSGMYNEAIDKYMKALEMNPASALAMYETAFSYNSLGNSETALKYLSNAMRYKGDVFAISCDLAGTITDNNGEPEKALEYYNMGIDYEPEFQMLYFNRGVTNMKLKKYPEAKKDFQFSIKLNPFHPTSHYLLSSVYILSGKEIAASLSALTYIILYSMNITENPVASNLNKINSFENAKYIIETAFAINDKKKSVQKPSENTGKKGLHINLNANSLFDDFFVIDMMISMKIALDASDTTGKKKSNDLEETLLILSSCFELLKPDKEIKSFAGHFYSPFFYSINKKGFTPLIANLLYYSGNPSALSSYLAENSVKAEKFKSWLIDYGWNIDAKSDEIKK